MSIKTALCFKKSDVIAEDGAITGPGRPSLEDRATCETDTSLIQLLPYITLVDKTTGKIFLYQRGTSGGESRLHGNWSMGLGGHIEDLPDEDKSLPQVVAECAARELEEEVGLKYTEERVLELINLVLHHSQLYYHPTNPVSAVHMACLLTYQVDRSELTSQEVDVINNGRWMSVEEIHLAIDQGMVLEDWSTYVLSTFKPNIVLN